MRYIDEFRDKKLVVRIAKRIREEASVRPQFSIMEVCGTHTMSIFRFGIRELLPPNIRLISGPGCPVCVTPNDYIDKAIDIARGEDVTVATFGDLFRVPGSASSLEKERGWGRDIRMVYSPMDALGLAKRNPLRQVVFLGIGFETTAPTVAAAILAAKRDGVKNFSVLSGHKTMPEVLAKLLGDKRLSINGFLLPGHVTAITGTAIYEPVVTRYKKRAVVAGFEALDIMQAILMLLMQKRPMVEIQYSRVINGDGNLQAQQVIDRVFEKTPSVWRGFGAIVGSGLSIKRAYSAFDAERKFKPSPVKSHEEKACRCGDVLKGLIVPDACALFAKRCTPEHPVGACMVSSEGTCAAYFKYRKHR